MLRPRRTGVSEDVRARVRSETVELFVEIQTFYEAIVLLTDHSDFDYDMIAKHAKLVMDTRDKYR